MTLLSNVTQQLFWRAKSAMKIAIKSCPLRYGPPMNGSINTIRLYKNKYSTRVEPFWDGNQWKLKTLLPVSPNIADPLFKGSRNLPLSGGLFIELFPASHGLTALHETCSPFHWDYSTCDRLQVSQNRKLQFRVSVNSGACFPLVLFVSIREECLLPMHLQWHFECGSNFNISPHHFTWGSPTIWCHIQA